MNEAKTYHVINELLGVSDTVRHFDATVNSTDEANRMCNVSILSGSAANNIDVRLMASVDDGLVMIPSEGSTVIVAMSTRVAPYVCMYSSVEKIVLLGGDYDGVPIVKHPTDVNKGLLKKVNNIESLVNHLIGNYNTHTHTGVTTGAGTSGVTLAIETGTIAPLTTQTDIEHPKHSH
jgi:hypothetical protein